MTTETVTAWSEALVVSWRDTQSLYIARLTCPGLVDPTFLEGYIMTVSDMRPYLEIPLSSMRVGYTQQDVEALETGMHHGGLEMQMAINAIMAHRNLTALGLRHEKGVDTGDLYRFLGLPDQPEIDGVIFSPHAGYYHTSRPDEIGLTIHGRGEKMNGKVDPMAAEKFVERLNSSGLRGVCQVRPFNFETWKQEATGDFDRIRLL